MDEQRQKFFIDTIRESYNTEIEFNDNEIVFLKDIDPVIKAQILSFYKAVLENQVN